MYATEPDWTTLLMGDNFDHCLFLPTFKQDIKIEPAGKIVLKSVPRLECYLKPDGYI